MFYLFSKLSFSNLPEKNKTIGFLSKSFLSSLLKRKQKFFKIYFKFMLFSEIILKLNIYKTKLYCNYPLYFSNTLNSWLDVQLSLLK